MLNALRRISVAGLRITMDELNLIHAQLQKFLIVTMVVIIAMWGINIVGLKEANFVFFFLGGFLILSLGSAPFLILSGAGLGVVVHGLRDDDLSKGAVAGVQGLYKIVIGSLFGFWVASGILATWSFRESPFSFFPIIAMIMLLAVMSSVFGLKGKKVPIAIITTYAVAVIGIAAWKTISIEDRPSIGSYTIEKTVTPASPVYQKFLATREWSKEIRVEGDECFRLSTENPSAKDLVVEVRGVGHPTWYEWEQFKVLKREEKLPYKNPGWIRFKANGPDVEVTYRIRPGACS